MNDPNPRNSADSSEDSDMHQDSYNFQPLTPNPFMGQLNTGYLTNPNLSSAGLFRDLFMTQNQPNLQTGN
jgi:hypothetical protein